MFLPVSPQELKNLGWSCLDVILVSGDSYIDSPFMGVAILGKLLVKAGFKVGIIAQPDLDNLDDIGRLGMPRLFWGVSAGCVDSLVANYTALKKPRSTDDYTPGGLNNRRPDRACLVYTNLIRRYMKTRLDPGGEGTAAQPPIVLGGIEASLRRVAHYDYWTDRIRGSILFDAKADYLLYGMAETSTLQLAQALRDGTDPRGIRGLAYISRELPPDTLELPSFQAVEHDKAAFTAMFHTFYRNNDPLTAKALGQLHRDRWLIQNPPALALGQKELDAVYSLGFERAQHPWYEAKGPVKALETIGFSIPTHRGCYGECNYCAIAVHEGRTVSWRSAESIVAEAKSLTSHPKFKGYIQDLGGPTANMYGYECAKKLKSGACPQRRCMYPQVCPQLKPDHKPHLDLLKAVRRLPGVKKVFVASGLRYDLMYCDRAQGEAYLRELVENHVSGQLKVAPEHSQEGVLDLMGKPGTRDLLAFKKDFDRMSREAGLPQFLTYYLIAAHPGTTQADMDALKAFAGKELRISPEQVQIFTPTPGTYSSLMYWTETDPFTGKALFVEKDPQRKARQKDAVTLKPGPGASGFTSGGSPHRNQYRNKPH